MLQKSAQSKTFSGSVLVAQYGQVILSKGYGLADREKKIPNTAQTRFRIYSITKGFTATAILMLQEQGKLNVQESICEYFVSCPEAWKPITIHYLLTHTSGIPDTVWPHLTQEISQVITSTLPLEKGITDLKTKPLVYQPGDHWEYNQTGYVLLGKIIESSSGQTYEAFLQKNIFEPLHMSNTGYDHNRDDLAIGYKDSTKNVADPVNSEVLFSGGGLYSTVEDLYLWDQALYTNKLLPQKALDTMFTPYVLLDASDPNSQSYGYGWIIVTTGQRRIVYHPGGYYGYASMIRRFPDDYATIIILSNQEDINQWENAKLIEQILFGEK